MFASRATQRKVEGPIHTGFAWAITGAVAIVCGCMPLRLAVAQGGLEWLRNPPVGAAMPDEPSVIVSQQTVETSEEPGAEPAGRMRSLITKIAPGRGPFRILQDRRKEVQATQFKSLPFSAICRLQIKFPGINQPYQGTGFLVGPGLVITAAHVLNDPEHGPAEQAVVTAGCFEDKIGALPDPRYSQFVDGRRLRTQVNWGRPDYRPDNDYGAILLPDEGMFRDCGHFRLKDVSEESLVSQIRLGTNRFLVAGFPVEKTEGKRIWYETGRLLSPARGFIRHLIDTTKGQSGSPLAAITLDEVTHRKIPVVFGIHSRGGGDRTHNVAVRVDERLIEWVELRKKELRILNRR